MRVLIACEFSGIVRDAFAKRGHEAVSCDLLPSERPGLHIQTDVLNLLKKDAYDLLIAHPPCTYLSNSGVCWLHKQPNRWQKMMEAALFFKTLLDAPIKQIAIENPIPHKYAIKIIGRKADQIIPPWMFGHMEQKATCLWLKGLSKLYPTSTNLECQNNRIFVKMMKLPKRERERLHYLPPSETRQQERSRTFPRIAEAMANQWG